MPVKDESDAQFDRIGATISRRFMDVNGKIETTRNPRPRIDRYAGDGRSALGDATGCCANCEATERRNVQQRAVITAYVKQRTADVRQKRRLIGRLKSLRNAVAAYVNAHDAEMNASEQALLDDWTIWEATENAFAALKAAAGIATKEES